MIQGAAATTDKTGLSAELLEFLVEFSIALHRTSMYPPGHPSQEKSAAGVVQRLVSLLGNRASVSVGIAKRQIVIEGVASDPRHPVLRGLAEKFHKQHIGAVVFERGVTAAELAAVMQLIAVANEKTGRPLALENPDALKQWANLRLYPLTYDQLELVGGPDEDEDDDQREQANRSAQLWIGLARAALAAKPAVPETENDPSAVAQAINEHPAAQAYDQVLVGYLLQIAESLKQDGGKGTDAVRRRMSRLIAALDPATLQRLVDMGGDFAQRREFMLNATDSLSVDAVLQIVRSAAQTSGQSISTSMMRMLSKLSSVAETGSAQLQNNADQALREQVRDLISDWSLRDPNPDAYTRALQSMAIESMAKARIPERHAPEPSRIVQMAIEVEAVGIPFWRAVGEMEDQPNGLADIVALLSAAPPESEVALSLWERLATEENVRLLLAREPVDFDVIHALLDRLDDASALQVLLDTIAASESRATRMGVFRRVVSMGPKHADKLVERTSDTRWYIVRNMLAMLNEMQHVPAGFSPAEFARHADARVRREALQLWLRIPSERDRAVVAALKESDDRGLRIGVAALREGVPEMCVPIIANRLADKNLTTDIRLQLVRALGQVRNPMAADTLLKVVLAGKTLFGAPKFAETTPVLLVALTTLAEKWSHDVNVKPVVERARDAKDPDVRAAVAKAGKP